MNKVEEVNEMVRVDHDHLAERFKAEVLQEWDEHGQGNFAQFVLIRMSQKWQEYVLSN